MLPCRLQKNFLLNNSNFKVKEFCYDKKLTKSEAIKKAETIMGDDTLHQELDRIYMGSDIKKFISSPSI